ncbi:hypothetical protein GY45DRAFT_1318725 [Cubamyces sp. BRFM 1775]|nr:hypothetical protein GY45DRAFT_1318725 [Cubamyces sp. BRFM 1775]
MFVFLFSILLLIAAPARISAASLADAQLPLSPDEPLHSKRHTLIPCATMLGDLVSAIEPFFRDIDTECGLFDVPLDWAHPEVGDQQIYYARYRATPDVEREGTIFIDPGRSPPGMLSIDWMGRQSWMLTEVPVVHASTLGKYDLVVFSTRGNWGHPNLNLNSSPSRVECFDTKEDKWAFYLRASEELGIEPAWDDQMHFIREQTREDAKNWLHLQSMAVEECIRKQNTTMLTYIGTAAAVRDLVAMADFFDGPSSAINFWGLESGARIGQYLLEMFPERTGRVLLQAPQDLNAYLYQDSYEVWRDDITHAHLTIDHFVEFCVRTGDQDCSTYWADLIIDDGDMMWYQWRLFDVAQRRMSLGWR